MRKSSSLIFTRLTGQFIITRLYLKMRSVPLAYSRVRQMFSTINAFTKAEASSWAYSACSLLFSCVRLWCGDTNCINRHKFIDVNGYIYLYIQKNLHWQQTVFITIKDTYSTNIHICWPT